MFLILKWEKNVDTCLFTFFYICASLGFFNMWNSILPVMLLFYLSIQFWSIQLFLITCTKLTICHETGKPLCRHFYFLECHIVQGSIEGIQFLFWAKSYSTLWKSCVFWQKNENGSSKMAVEEGWFVSCYYPESCLWVLKNTYLFCSKLSTMLTCGKSGQKSCFYA